MKKRLLILFGVLFISMLVVGAVNAFTMGAVDGQWSHIEPVDENNFGFASNVKWATGPFIFDVTTGYDDPDFVWVNYNIQSDYSSFNPPANDWNQVRYGWPDGATDTFGNQSGFGFDGVDNINEGDDDVLTEEEAFLLGKWCHFNNEITFSNQLDYVDLEVRIEGIFCPAGEQIDKNILEVAYRFTLDETPNNPEGTDCDGDYAFCPYTLGSDTNCPHQNGVNSNGCADKVSMGATSLSSTFVCTSSDSQTEYRVAILGSVPLANSCETCPPTPEGDLAFDYYSAEKQDNCSCLYAIITEVDGTVVALNDFSATSTEAGVDIAWETASEVDNIGFNLYRSSSPTGLKVKLNESMIPSKAIGSTSGASYTFLDENILAAGKLFYWLESIDLSGRSGLNGPVEVFSFK